MKPFITGAAGLIGSELAKRLGKKSVIKCFDNLSSGKEENLPVNRIFFKADIRNYKEVHGLIQGTDTVFHLAAHTNSRAGIANPQLDYENQLLGTRNILDAMGDWGIKKLIYTSTCGVYGDDAVEPIAETHSPLVPICPYAQCKLVSEWMIRDLAEKYDIQVWILRLGNIVGGVMQNGVIRDLVRKLKEDKTKLDVMGSKIQSRPFISVEDCVDGILYAFGHSKEKFNLFNVGGSESTTIAEIVTMLLQEAGLDILVNYDERDRGWDGSAIQVRLNVNKIKKLGWEVKLNSNEAVRKAIKEILKYEDFS